MYLGNIKHLDITHSNKILGDGFVYLTNIQTLNMHYCREIKDTSFVYLKNIKYISMDGCYKEQKDFARQLEINIKYIF